MGWVGGALSWQEVISPCGNLTWLRTINDWQHLVVLGGNVGSRDWWQWLGSELQRTSSEICCMVSRSERHYEASRLWGTNQRKTDCSVSLFFLLWWLFLASNILIVKVKLYLCQYRIAVHFILFLTHTDTINVTSSSSLIAGTVPVFQSQSVSIQCSCSGTSKRSSWSFRYSVCFCLSLLTES